MNLRQARQTLNIGLGATPEMIKKAFRQKAFEVHPDRNPHDSKATKKFQVLGEACSLLLTAINGSSARAWESYGKNLNTSRIKSYCAKGMWHEAVEVSEAEIDSLFEEKEWHVLKYCACCASNPAIQQRAMERLAAGKRYGDLLKVCRPISDGYGERTRYVLSIFERNIETITGGSLNPIEHGKLKEVMDFTIENTKDLRVAEKILDWCGANSFSLGLGRIKNTGVLKFIMDAMEQRKMWREIKDGALYSSAHMEIRLRECLTLILERHLDEIIGAKQKDVLVFLWRNTQNSKIKDRIQDALIEAGDYHTLRESLREFLYRAARSRERLAHDYAV